MAELTVVARAKAKQGNEQVLERELRGMVPLAHQEKGCLVYALHRSVEDAATFVVIEKWASKEDFDRHFTTPHVKALLEKMPGMVAVPPEIKVFEAIPEGDSKKGRI